MRKRYSSEPDYFGESGGINLTPLIDVVFVVLIMFILVAPMFDLDRVQLAAGRSHDTQDRTQTPEPSSLLIHVHEDNSIWINRAAVSPDKLREVLRRIYGQNPKLIPQLFHDRKAYFGTYQLVKNAVEAVGFAELDVVLEPAK